VRSLDCVRYYVRRDQYGHGDLHIHRKHKGRILRPGPKPSGHVSVLIRRVSAGGMGSIDVHTLVLKAFVGPCPEGHECCHHDDDPTNNNLTNLRWGTRSDNLHDAARNGKKPIGEKSWNAKLSNADVAAIKARVGNRPKMPVGLHDRSLESMTKIAAEYGVSNTAIRLIIRGRAWKHIA
jgi:hypothetical protein